MTEDEFRDLLVHTNRLSYDHVGGKKYKDAFASLMAAFKQSNRNAEADCTCYPGGINPDTFEGPQVWCDAHGQPSVAYEHGLREGRRDILATENRNTEAVQRVRELCKNPPYNAVNHTHSGNYLSIGEIRRALDGDEAKAGQP